MIIRAYSKTGDNYLDGRQTREALRQVFKKLFSWYMDEETVNQILEEIPDRIKLI
jgi:hypothetical protein